MRDRGQQSRRHRDGARGKPKRLSITGAVTARPGRDGEPDLVRVDGEDGRVYHVLPTERGIELAHALAGCRAVVVGHVVEEDGEHVLEVRRFRGAGETPSAPDEQ